MAAGSSGQNQIINLGVQASTAGIKESIDELKRLGGQLAAIDKQLRSGLNTDALGKQFATVVKEFDKLSKSIASGSTTSQNSIDKITSQVKALNAEVAKGQKTRGIGFVGDKSDKEAVKKYQERMEAIGTPVMGGAKSMQMLVRNQRNLAQSLNSTSTAGIATQASIRAVHDAGAVAFMPALNRGEKFKIQLASLRKDIVSVTHTLQSAAKDQQWIGRQMIEGITVPVVGFGTMAVRSFMAVQSEMIQLKKVTEFGAATNNADAFYDSLVNGAQGIREMSREFGLSRKSATALFKDVAALGVDGEQDIKAFANAVSEISLVGEVDTSTAMQFFRTMNAIFAEGKTNAEGLAHTRDLMAQMSAVADETSLQLQDLAQAFPEVAPVMKQMGFSAAGVAASLAGMYKRGIPATEAAHGLKFALQRLVSPTKDAEELISKMGFTFFDASGNIKKADVEIMAMAKNLEEGMSAEEASKALGELFGLRQSARMKSYFQDVNIGRKELELYTKGTLAAADMTSDYARGLVAAGFGAKNAIGPIDRYNKALEEIKKDPTIGLKKLKSAFDDFKVQLGATIAPALLIVGEKLTALLDAFTNLPNGIQIAVIGAAGFLAVLGPITYMSAQATHAMASMGRMAVAVLPKMVDITEGMARSMAAAGRRDVAQVGSRFVGLQKFADRFRLKLGIPTAAEKAVKSAAGTGATAAIAPQTAATNTLTAANNALTIASTQVAAAQAAQTAAHNTATGAITAQAAVVNKGAAFNTKLNRWIDLNTNKILNQTQAIKQMTLAQQAAYYSAPLRPGYTPPIPTKPAKGAIAAGMTAQYQNIVKQAQAATQAQKQQLAFQNLITTAQNLNAQRLANLPAPPKQKFIDSMGFGSKADGVKAQFASLYASADRVFFKPIGKAADFTKGKLLAMARAAKMSAVGQGVISAGSATVGAFRKGSAGDLSGVLGAAAMTKLGGVGKIFGNLGKVFGIFTGKLNLIGGPLGTIISLFLKFNKVTLILTVVAGLISFVVMMFKGMKTNWEAVMAKIQPGIDAIKAAFERLKETFAGVFEKMMNIFGQLGSGAKEGQGAASAFEGVGSIIGTVFDGIASAIDFVGNLITWLWPFFERTAYIVKNTVGFIAALFKGEWSQAFMFAAAVVYEWVRPVIMVFDFILKAAAQFIANFLDLMSTVTSWVPWVGDAVASARDAVEGFSDRGIMPFLDETFRSGLGGIFGPGTTGPAKEKAKNAGGEIGETLGDAINDGAGSAADGGSWVKEWINKVVEQIDKQLDKLRKSALDALQKAQDAALKVYDDRIKAIEDQEKAEEKLYKTEEYLANKREALAKRNVDIQNYLKNKAVAIYEGRYDDARMLDLKERSDKNEFNKNIGDIEKNRSRDLLKESRDLMKDQINIEKDAAKERLDIQKQAFEDYLDELYKMTPVTVEQFQSMMDQINGVLQANGATWPEYATTAMERMGNALRDANKAVINEFSRSENNPLLQWVAAFAEPEVVKILKDGLAKAGGGGGGGSSLSSGGDGTETAGPAGPIGPESGGGGISFEEQQKKYKNARMIFDKDFHKDKKSFWGLGTDAGKTTANANDRTDISAINAAEQETIDIIKAQIKVGDERNKGHELYSKAMRQIKADMYDYYHTYTDEDAKNQESVVENLKKIQGATYLFNQVSISQLKKNTDSVKVFIDDQGMMWEEVNGKMVNRYGETARAIRDENGKMTGDLVKNNGTIVRGTEETFTTAEALLQRMTDKQIKPGTLAAQEYVKKINDLGYAVYTLPDGKTIVIDADTSKLKEAIERVNRFFKANSQNGYVGMDFVELLGQTGSVEAALGYIDPLGWMNVPGPDGKTFAQKIREGSFASGGLVKAQKDGIIANIGEGGFDEYVITTDPKYRASNLGYLAAAASKLGVKMASGAAIKAASGGMFTGARAASESAEYASGMGGDVYINVDTFIGEEQWFAEMASKYNMKTTPRQRKIEGQQKRVVSSYNDRYRLR